ncbi:AAA family ATPase [Actinoplanes sp. NPDC020271]|uniref:AAA family ATPase n=1 Tax=Actinoplanes sp. NPDC020271 TaxID=3363896 RepID=UPI00378DEC73
MTGRFLRDIAVSPGFDAKVYPFDLPVVKGLVAAGRLDIGPGVTFLAGDNGSGKSTLIEAIAVAAGFNAEGGSRNFQFATKATESSLGTHLTVGRVAGRRERSNFFFRAESFYNVITEIDRLGVGAGYGGRSLHHRSHGESFLDLIERRFHPHGLYLLDEPEAALSPRGLLITLARLHALTQAGSQMLIATHSPILLALPGATILQISDDGRLRQVDYEEADAVRVTRDFLDAPERTLRHLLAD